MVIQTLLCALRVSSEAGGEYPGKAETKNPPNPVNPVE